MSVSKRTVASIFLGAVFLIVLPVMLPILFVRETGGMLVIDRPVEAPYLDGIRNDWMLVYFGYVGCAKVCTPILSDLAGLYRKLSHEGSDGGTSVVFVNLKEDVDPDQPAMFARAFHPGFEGVYLSGRQLMGIDRELAVFFSDSLSDPTEINHSDHLYLIRRSAGGYLLKRIYSTHPLRVDEIVREIHALQKETP